MNRREQQTLRAIFEEPPPAIDWEAIEDLLIAVGCRVITESDERVNFEKSGIIGSFQRPVNYSRPLEFLVRAVRDYLVSVGVSP